MKHPIRKIVASSLIAASLFVVPQLNGEASAASPETINTTHQVLSYGDTGASVKDLQEKLNQLGYYHDAIDGIYGSHTRSAVRGYQGDNHLIVDGIAGPQTLGSLFKSNAIASDAKALQGTPYVWGGESPKGFDCSGFIQYVFQENGITVPRTSAAQWRSGTPVSSLAKGDLVFFNTSGSGVSHVGIYLGDGTFIHASSSHGVIVSKMDNPYWKPRYVGAKSYF